MKIKKCFMKVLEFPNYITIDSVKGLNRNRTGYGYMTIDIATSLAKKGIEIELLTQSYITKEINYQNVKILRRTWKNLFKNLKLRHFIETIKILYTYPPRLLMIPKIFFYNISMGYFEQILRHNNYDIVHIHGIGYYTLPIIRVCEKLNIKYVVTLHGLNSFSDSTNISESGRKIEKDFIINAAANNISTTVISTGIRKTIMNFLSIKDSQNFQVITNSFHINNSNKKRFNLRRQYRIDESAKIMLSIGNIGRRKNQIQIIRAFNKLPLEEKQNLFILFCGYDSKESGFKEEINKLELSSHLIYCGDIPKDELTGFYQQSDFVILASISEGFGLSLIEGFSFGLPCITFSDLDAVEDIFHSDAVLLLKERTDEALAQGIMEFVSKSWDKEKIKIHSKKFTMAKMATNYINYFKHLIA